MGKGKRNVLSKDVQESLVLKELWLEPPVFDPLASRTGTDPCVSPVLGAGPGTELGLGVQP